MSDEGNAEPYACEMCDRYEQDLERERAQVADLKARLRAVRAVFRYEFALDGANDRVTDLRVKNWRKP